MFDRLLRHRRDPDFVFVVTFGRSGSTLVQGLLNTLPRTLVRGENAFFLKGLFESAHTGVAFASRHARHHPGKRSSAFFGVRHLAMQTFARHARALSLDVLYGAANPREVDRLGFKEVLWHQIPESQTEAFFDWFDEVFPGAKFVLNTRDPEVTIDSGFWRSQERETALARIRRVIELQDWLERRAPERVFRTRYETLTGDDHVARDAMLVGLATFVAGSCPPELLDALHATLEIGHGPRPFGASRREAPGPSEPT